MTPSTTPDRTAYVVTDRHTGLRLELLPDVDREITILVCDGGAIVALQVPAHELVRAAVAAALDAFEAPHSPRTDGTGEHDPSRTEQFRTEREQEN
jgi:hypothetical protein